MNYRLYTFSELQRLGLNGDEKALIELGKRDLDIPTHFSDVESEINRLENNLKITEEEVSDLQSELEEYQWITTSLKLKSEELYNGIKQLSKDTVGNSKIIEAIVSILRDHIV